MHSNTSQDDLPAAANDSGEHTFESPGLRVLGDGPPVLLLHAWMSSRAQWDPLMHRLGGRHRCIAVDLHGYGDNPPAPQGEDFSLDDDVELIRGYLSDLALANEPLHIVAHSYGAAVALRFAQRLPACVASLTLYEPTAFNVLDEDSQEAAAVAGLVHRVSSLVADGRGLQAAKFFIDCWNGPGSFEHLSTLQRARSAMQIAQVALGYRAVMNTPMRLAHCHSIHSRTLLLGGPRSEPATREVLTRLAVALPNVKSEWIETDPMQMIEGFIDIDVKRNWPSRAVNAFRLLARRLASA
jgi:pimeloyl-ACP methyl ester carboxylesterase